MKLAEYAEKYSTIRMERRDGVLQMTFHTDGGPLQWGLVPHEEFARAFRDVGSDRETRVVIMTGTGDTFSGPRPNPDDRLHLPPRDWDILYWEGKQLLEALLDIEVPMISAVNGPVLRHTELPLLCDIVLACPEAVFQDSGHFRQHLVPGDGVHIIYPLLLGLNRARYFLLTGQELNAQKAQELGLVAEVLPREQVLARAWELAAEIALRPPLVTRYTRVMLTQTLKRQLVDLLGYGLALEALGSTEDWIEDREANRTARSHVT